VIAIASPERLWSFDVASGLVSPGAALAAGERPVAVAAAGGTGELFVVTAGISGSSAVLRCSTAGCVTLDRLPSGSLAQVVVSPQFAVDHTLFVASATDVLVSRDGGATFATTPHAGGGVASIAAVAGAQGTVLDVCRRPAGSFASTLSQEAIAAGSSAVVPLPRIFDVTSVTGMPDGSLVVTLDMFSSDGRPGQLGIARGDGRGDWSFGHLASLPSLGGTPSA
jgi:hypothetical protein